MKHLKIVSLHGLDYFWVTAGQIKYALAPVKQ